MYTSTGSYVEKNNEIGLMNASIKPEMTEEYTARQQIPKRA